MTCSGNKSESYSSLGGANTNPPETSPLGLYTRLFGPGFQDPSKGDWKPDPQVMLQQSALSVVAEDRKRFYGQDLSASDKARMDQYFTSVRELEQSMEAALKRPDVVAQVTIPAAPGEMPVSKSVPELQKVVPMMSKLVALGLATNQTHVFNIALAEPGSTIFMPGDSKPFHQQTHEEPIDPVLGYQPVSANFSTHSMKFFATLIKELDDVKEGDGTLLDHSLVLAYTDTSYAKLHALDGIPMLLAGSASGRVKTGYHIAGDGSPVSRVGLTIQQAMGLSIDGWEARARWRPKKASSPKYWLRRSWRSLPIKVRQHAFQMLRAKLLFASEGRISHPDCRLRFKARILNPSLHHQRSEP